MPRGDLRIELKPPRLGLRTDLPFHQVPEGFFIGGQNMVPRDGRMIIRPGYAGLTTSAPSASRVMGIVYYQDNTLSNKLVHATLVKLWSYDGSTWSDITGTALNGTTSNQARFAVFPFGQVFRLVMTNGVDAPQSWTGTGSFAALGGSPPIAKCVTVAFQRLILGSVTESGQQKPSRLWVSGFQDPTSWNIANVVDLPDTQDTIVEIRALNAQAFAIYKTKSQWVGIGAGNLFPFIFELRDQQVGPVSPGCVVQAENDHYYLGTDGDVYKFDGTRCTPIGGWVKRSIQSDMDFSSNIRAHGFYDQLNREIWWFWPTTAGSTQTGGITYRLPYGDVPGAFSPLMAYQGILSASAAWTSYGSLTWNSLTGTWDTLGQTYPSWDSMQLAGRPGDVVGDSTGQVSAFGQTGGDNGASISGFFDYPFMPLAGIGENIRIDAIEAFWKQTVTSTPIDIVLITSNTLADTGTAAAAQTFDIQTGVKPRAIYYDTVARYASTRFRVASTLSSAEYRGGVLYAYRRGEA